MNQDEKMVLLIVQESLVKGDAISARQKELAEMLNRVISGGLTQRAPDVMPCGHPLVFAYQGEDGGTYCRVCESA